MGKQKQRKKYEAKPKAVRINGYFSKDEVKLIDFVATKLLKVSVTQFVKGATVEMAQAALRLAQEKRDAEQQQVTGESAEGSNSGSEETTTESGSAESVSETAIP